MRVMKDKVDANGNKVKTKDGLRVVRELDYIACNICLKRIDDSSHHTSSTAGRVDICRSCLAKQLGRDVEPVEESDYLSEKFEEAGLAEHYKNAQVQFPHATEAEWRRQAAANMAANQERQRKTKVKPW